MSSTDTLKFSVRKMTRCVQAASDSKVIQSGDTRFRGMPGVGSYVNNGSPHCRNYPLNRICMRCHLSDDHTRQESGSEVCLNLIPEWGNTRLDSSGELGVREQCLKIRYISLISLRQPFYHWMIRDILYSTGSFSGESWGWQWFSNQL